MLYICVYVYTYIYIYIYIYNTRSWSLVPFFVMARGGKLAQTWFTWHALWHYSWQWRLSPLRIVGNGGCHHCESFALPLILFFCTSFWSCVSLRVVTTLLDVVSSPVFVSFFGVGSALSAAVRFFGRSKGEETSEAAEAWGSAWRASRLMVSWTPEGAKGRLPFEELAVDGFSDSRRRQRWGNIVADVPLGMIREDCLQTRDFSQMANGPPLSPSSSSPPSSSCPPGPWGPLGLCNFLYHYHITMMIIIMLLLY